MSSITIDTAAETPIYAQIMDRIRALVRDGELRPGAPLPSVRQLAADLEINPNTVAKAYTLLEREGIVRSERRRGTFVAKGAAEPAGRTTHRRLEEAVDRVLDEARRLGIEANDVLEAMARRVGEQAAGSGGEAQ